MLDSLIAALPVMPVTSAIADRGGLFRRDYSKGYGVKLADALIAATAESCGATMVTLNSKHFPMLAAVSVPYRKV